MTLWQVSPDLSVIVLPTHGGFVGVALILDGVRPLSACPTVIHPALGPLSGRPEWGRRMGPGTYLDFHELDTGVVGVIVVTLHADVRVEYANKLSLPESRGCCS